MFLFFFIRSGAKVSEPGKGPNHLGEGWRERNGVYKALLSLSFCDHHLLKRKLYCWLIGLVWKGQCLCRKILVPSFPITLSRYYIFIFFFFLYCTTKNDFHAFVGYINVTIIIMVHARRVHVTKYKWDYSNSHASFSKYKYR